LAIGYNQVLSFNGHIVAIFVVICPVLVEEATRLLRLLLAAARHIGF
jgi:hypothetical protein